MFDQEPPGPAALSHADDAAAVAAIEEWDCREVTAGARLLAAIAGLTRRRCEKEGMRWTERGSR